MRCNSLQVEGVRLPVAPGARRAHGLQGARPVAPEQHGREEDVGAAAVGRGALQLAQELGEQVEAGLGAPQRNLLLIHSAAVNRAHFNFCLRYEQE